MMSELAHGDDGARIRSVARLIERIEESAVWRIRKFANDEAYKANNPYAVVEFRGNCLCNEGINELFTILCSAASGTKYDNSNANLIVGTGSGGAQATDTEATFTSGVKKTMDTSYPTYGTVQKATWKATYGSTEANQAWNEFGVLNAASSGKLLNRKVEAEGTKTSGQTWELTLEITLS